MSQVILESTGLTKQFPVGGWLARRRRVVHALTDVALSIRSGETLAVVGESGCGKTTLGRCLIRLVEPTAGTVRLHGQDVAEIIATAPLKFRRAVQIVFQDPYASLNPRRTIAESLDDPLRIHGTDDRDGRRVRAEQLMAQVGLACELLGRYPHELSGGQRQRVAIARALASGPEIIVCDEAVSSLDVSIQAQIINLLRDIQAETGISYVFITHNLHLVHRIADRIVVMYLGQIVEEGDAAALRARLIHPSSSALFAAAPRVNRSGRRAARRAAIVAGEVPSPIDPPSGCRFHTRCPLAQAVCAERQPALEAVAGRFVRCHFAVEIAAGKMGTAAPPQ